MHTTKDPGFTRVDTSLTIAASATAQTSATEHTCKAVTAHASRRRADISKHSMAALCTRVIAVFSLSIAMAAPASAKCFGIGQTKAPLVPDPKSASMEEMFSAQEATREYVSDIEAYLECRSVVISAQMHNLLVNNAQQAAQGYNQALQVYLEGDKLLAADQ